MTWRDINITIWIKKEIRREEDSTINKSKS